MRHGYESYSFHSQYNLLAAAMLAIAWSLADDRAAEAPCPAEVGGFAFALQPAFHKVFANAAGTYVEIDTGADLHYNPTGILRIHHRAVDPETLSDGVVSEPAYRTPAPPGRNAALGPGWRGRPMLWNALANHGGADLQPPGFRLVEASPARVALEISLQRPVAR